jgi:2,4-dienoyl-CoA reductase-like NADH-dependent reductase (Old Yellow Enzyme family)
MSALFRELTVGQIGTFSHRIVLAPLTRNRATEAALAPTDDVSVYYEQRSSPGGLLISEATNISGESLAYPRCPGIWTDDQGSECS